MHYIFLAHKITRQELVDSLEQLFENETFFFLDENKSGEIPVRIFENKSYLRSQIELFIHNEERGFRYADALAEYLSEKYNCDAVRELSSEIAMKEFNDKLASQIYSVLYRKGKKYIIRDTDIQEEKFEIKIIKELKNYS